MNLFCSGKIIKRESIYFFKLIETSNKTWDWFPFQWIYQIGNNLIIY